MSRNVGTYDYIPSRSVIYFLYLFKREREPHRCEFIATWEAVNHNRYHLTHLLFSLHFNNEYIISRQTRLASLATDVTSSRVGDYRYTSSFGHTHALRKCWIRSRNTRYILIFQLYELLFVTKLDTKFLHIYLIKASSIKINILSWDFIFLHHTQLRQRDPPTF